MYIHYSTLDGQISFSEAYCTKSLRFTVKDDIKYYTVLYSPTLQKCCICFDHNCTEGYVLDEKLLDKSELKGFIFRKAEEIKVGFVEGLEYKYCEFTESLTNDSTDVIIEDSSYYRKDVEKEITANTDDFESLKITVFQIERINYDFRERDNHYYLSTSHLGNIVKFSTTEPLSSEAQFDAVLQEKGIDKTFSEIFGELKEYSAEDEISTKKI